MKYSGNNVSYGYAVGEVYLYEPFSLIVSKVIIPENKVSEEMARFRNGKNQAKEELQAIVETLSKDNEDKAKIFAAHMEILYDTVMEEDILLSVEGERYSADYAVSSIFDKYTKMLEEAKDELIRERVADICDVKNRLLRCLSGIPEKNLSALDTPAVIVANNLLPSDTATLDRNNVLAIVTQTGGETSHSAIIAKSYEIPAILGMKDAMKILKHGEIIIVDAVNGDIYTEPTEEQIRYFEEEKRLYTEKSKEIKKYISRKSVMRDGSHIGVYLNIETGKQQELLNAENVDGVGLFRTEFLYMEHDQPPSEEEQFVVYKKVLAAFGSKPVVLRTLDIGGDKMVPYLNLSKEDNPFLGNRALRLCLSRPDIFKTQLRAAFRASAYGNLWIMFPMVGTLDDIKKAKAFVEIVKAELRTEKIGFKEDVRIGIMIEIPSIALMADKAALEVDFASVGSNDLCQYTLAVDRMNPDIAGYYQSYHPAIFRLLGNVAEEFAKQGKPVSICGELGGDLLAPAALVGLGINKLSMGLSSIAQTKKLVSSLTMERARKIAGVVKNCATAGEVHEYLKKELEDII